MRPSEEALAHLEACPLCQTFRDEHLSVRRLVGSLERVSAPPDFEFRLRARLAAERSAHNHRRFWNSLAPSTQALALVASLALLIVASVLFRQIIFVPENDAEHTVTAQLPAEIKAQPQEAASTDEAIQVASSQNTTDNEGTIAAETHDSLVRSDSRSGMLRGKKLDPQRDAFSARTVGPGIERSDFVVRPAPIITRDPLIPLEVRSSAQPAKVLFEDVRGETRTFSLEPVTFGAQELIEQKGASRVFTSTARGIW